LTLAAIGHLLAPAFERIYIAASVNYRDLFPWGTHPLLDPLWSSELLEFVHHGCAARRIEKLRFIAGFDAAVNNNDLAMHAQFSVSKSIVSILVGISIDAGNIDGVATPYLDLFSYSEYENWDDRKNDLSILDVLTMRTGLEWDEWDPPYSAADNRLITFYREEVDYSKGLLDLPISADPGSSFVYNTVASISLGQAVENSSALSLVDFMQTYLFVPLGIVEASWEETPTALPNLGSGLHLYTRDLAKFGQMYMDGGSWNGNEIVSSEWVTASLQPHVEIGYSSPEGRVWLLDGYGYQWWIGHFDLEGTTYPTYAARGYGQQTLMIIPDLELVVAVNAHAYEELESQANQVFDLIATHVIPAAG
jgi:CubicO group peptidase (beta-lactamase class C family)